MLVFLKKNSKIKYVLCYLKVDPLTKWAHSIYARIEWKAIIGRFTKCLHTISGLWPLGGTALAVK